VQVRRRADDITFVNPADDPARISAPPRGRSGTNPFAEPRAVRAAARALPIASPVTKSRDGCLYPTPSRTVEVAQGARTENLTGSGEADGGSPLGPLRWLAGRL